MTAAVDAQAYCGACRVRAPVRFAACTLSQLCLSDLRDFTLLLSLFRRVFISKETNLQSCQDGHHLFTWQSESWEAVEEGGSRRVGKARLKG